MLEPAIGTCRVVAVRQEAIDVKSFRLRPLNGGGPLPTPGCHIDLLLAPGLIRHYSVLNGPGDRDGYLIAAKLEDPSRGGSRLLHESCFPDGAIEAGALRNNFPLRPEATRHVLLGGGIGITPLLSMARALHAVGGSFELNYFARSPDHAAFRDVPDAEGFGTSVAMVYGAGPAEVADHVHRALAATPPGTHCYICGPAGFMQCAIAQATDVLPSNAVHRESFTAAPPADMQANQPFVVRLARQGLDVAVAADKSIVEALAEAGVAVPVSCEQGVCGTCVTRVVSGEPDHRDNFLMDDEKAAGDMMTLCVSRSRSGLLSLDL